VINVKEIMMHKNIASHAVFGCACAAVASAVTYIALSGRPQALTWPPAHAQTTPPANTGVKQIDLFKTTMNDVMGRVVTIRRTEREPGNGSDAHRHPGSHTFGYVLEGAYEVKIDDGPLQRLGPGETFYEPPNALHAVSRNGSKTLPVKYLVIQVSDPTKPATVPEKK
jgi:quercetin dioxygenase-like cupin family protein